MKQIDFRKDLLPLKDRIYRMALRITLNAPEAEDLTQDTLVRAWSKREELAGVDNIEAYCITVCRNLALDLIARKERTTETLNGDDTDTRDTALNPEEQLVQDDRLQRVHQLFNQLPEVQRSVLQLRDIEGMSYAEAAEALNMSEDLFKVTLHRARKALKAKYEKLENYGL